VRITQREPFDGPITLDLSKSSRQVGASLAARVMVEMEDAGARGWGERAQG
jgi:hypothetical protein